MLGDDGWGYLEEVSDNVVPLPVDNGGDTLNAGEDEDVGHDTKLNMKELQCPSQIYFQVVRLEKITLLARQVSQDRGGIAEGNNHLSYRGCGCLPIR